MNPPDGTEFVTRDPRRVGRARRHPGGYTSSSPVPSRKTGVGQGEESPSLEEPRLGSQESLWLTVRPRSPVGHSHTRYHRETDPHHV